MKNYFNQLTFREKLLALGQAKFLDISEFNNGVDILLNKKIVIVGAGAQGLNQGLNMRDMGLNVAYALRSESIKRKSESYKNAIVEGFLVGDYEKMLPTADLVLNLTPDKQHTQVINTIVPLMKKNAVLGYSHGFNLVEEGMKIREDITVIMVAPKSPGTEVREEFKRGFGVPTLIAVFPENDPLNIGFDYVKAYCYGTGGHRAGVLQSSFVAEVKSDLMGEQTILCGVLQTASLLCYDKMLENGIDSGYATRLIQLGWETITEALKHGGITCMMDRLSNPSKIKAYELSLELKRIMHPLFLKHMDDIITGTFSSEMMKDWENDDVNLLRWREETGNTAFEKSTMDDKIIPEQKYFDHGVLMVAFIKAGVELAFEVMVESGIEPESAYYESLHETPLIANTIARKKLYEMNRVISDTAEYGCYLFSHACVPLLQDFMSNITTNEIGEKFKSKKNVNNVDLIAINKKIREHPIEVVGAELRKAMGTMKAISKLNQ